MNKQLAEENKTKLLGEKSRLLKMLKRDTVPDPEIPGGHKPKFNEVGSEQGENAYEVEQFGNELSVVEDLEARLKQVESALGKIEEGTYGTCDQGDAIDEARLRAEPAATTCLKHAANA